MDSITAGELRKWIALEVVEAEEQKAAADAARR
jgi:hypothetical protein